MVRSMEKQTPLSARHQAAGAKMVPFAGYSMPLMYSSIQKEHEAVRQGVGLFDLSHMGEVRVSGPGALAFLQKVTTNDVSALSVGQVQYSAMCYPEGGVVDDLLVYRLADSYLLVINASNIEKDLEWLKRHAGADVVLKDESDATALVAIQGPTAEAVVSRMTDAPLPNMKFYTSAEGKFGSHRHLFSRTGYTGEDGFEIYCPSDAADALWQLAFQAGSSFNLTPVGLGARDSLRLEMKYALYGHEIDQDTNPIEAGLGWICKLDKGDFLGRPAIATMKDNGSARKLVCLELGPRAIPREGYRVMHAGSPVGQVRSGVFSPSLRCGIATAYVASEHSAIGTSLDVEIRDRHEPAKVVKAPFYKQGSHR